MATAHINANKGDFAKTVLMPGDPLRAKFIAETYLEDVKEVTNVRGMLGFTGTYKGKKVSVMGHGMGMPSVGIYSYELYKFYDVENIIRIGSCGGYVKEHNLYDVILAEKAWTTSTYAQSQNGEEKYIEYPSASLLKKIEDKAKELNIEVTNTTVHCNDTFYSEIPNGFHSVVNEVGATVVEMESFALYHNARVLDKNAMCILTVSDNLVTKQETSSEERQVAFTKMMELALGSI